MSCDHCGETLGPAGFCAPCLLREGVDDAPPRELWRAPLTIAALAICTFMGFAAGSASSETATHEAIECPTVDRGRAVIKLASVRAEAARQRNVATENAAAAAEARSDASAARASARRAHRRAAAAVDTSACAYLIELGAKAISEQR